MDNRDLSCVLCLMEEESIPHVLRSCVIAVRIWKKVYEWIGSIVELSFEEFEGFSLIATR